MKLALAIKPADIAVIIPALDEEGSIGHVVKGASAYSSRVIVVDNGSRDNTASIAREKGALVLFEERRGYGAACLRAIKFLHLSPPKVVVFMAGDGADEPSKIPQLVTPILRGACHMVIGSRSLANPKRPYEATLQKIGNRVVVAAINRLWETSYTDIGPFRAIGWGPLNCLQMGDKGFSWTVEMQIRAVKTGIIVKEVPVVTRPRMHGKQKISGTFWGSLRAGWAIITCILREYLWKDQKRLLSYGV